MTTGANIIQALEAIGCKLKEDRQGWMRSTNRSPLRADSDGNGFAMKISPDGEYGGFKDHASKQTGSLYTLAKLLGVEIVGVQRQTIGIGQATYASLADYAQAHGVTEDVFIKASWYQTEHDGRPCLRYPTRDTDGNDVVDRVRFIDDYKTLKQAKYKPVQSGSDKEVLYGLNRAIAIASETKLDCLVLCNGEASVIVAQHYGVPAFCVTGGENAIPDRLLIVLSQLWTRRIILALDCDDTGRDVASKINQQLPDSVIVDMMLSDKGDLADFCKLYTFDSYPQLIDLLNRQTQIPDDYKALYTIQKSDVVAKQLATHIGQELVMTGRPFLFPFDSFRSLGGFAKICMPKKITIVGAPSGGGKTTFLESLDDRLNLMGLRGLWFGSEWSATEMLMRGVQRWTKDPHVTVEQLIEYEIWKKYRLDGVSDSANPGTELSYDAQAHVIHISNWLASWHKTRYIESSQSLDDMLLNLQNELEKCQTEGVEISYCVFDYVQLLNAISPDKAVNKHEYALELIKRFAIQNNIHVFVGTQVTKSGTSDSHDGKRLASDKALFIRDDKANLFVMLNRVFVKDDMTGLYQATPCTYATVVKNNLGKTGDIPMLMDYQHIRFDDVDWTQDVEFSHIKGNIYHTPFGNSTHID